MSFILDQLRKSGRQRELELALRNREGADSRQAEGAASVPAQSSTGRRFHVRGIHLLLLFLGFFSVSALGSSFLFHGSPWRRQESSVPLAAGVQTGRVAPQAPKPAVVSPNPPAPAATGAPATATLRSGPAGKKEAPLPAVVGKMPGKKLKASSTAAVAAAGPRKGAVSGKRLPAQLPDPAPKYDEASAPAPAERTAPQENSRRTPYLDELPASLKKTLPPVHITSHLYRGNSRLVSINGRIMSEGVSLDDGLFLEEITREGVILSYHGSRFRVRAD